MADRSAGLAVLAVGCLREVWFHIYVGRIRAQGRNILALRKDERCFIYKAEPKTFYLKKDFGSHPSYDL
jgi:hypothetical protein